MDFEANLLVNPFSYILGAVSLVGFFIIARNEFMLCFHNLFGKHYVGGTRNGAISTREQNISNITQPTRKISIILGLICMGVFVSAAIFIIHVKTEQLELNIHLNEFLLITFAFIMFPGGLTGLAAGAWINATSRNHQGYLLQRLLAGMLIYFAFITLFEFTEVHLLLFLCGPAITLLVYQFSPIE